MYDDATIGQRNGIVEVAQAAVQTDCRERPPINAHRIRPQSLVTSLRTSQITS